LSEVTWKPVFKVLHWGVAGFIVIDYFWLEDNPHVWVGYLAVIFVLLRLILSFFFQTPKYSNLLAKTVYFSIWFLIVGLGVTGWMLGLEDYWGDERLEAIHINISHVLAVLVVIHFAGLIRNALWHKDKVWKGMLP